MYRVLRGAGVLALAALAFFATRAAWDMYQKFAASAQADEAAGKELASLKDEQAKVGAAIESLSSDRGVEVGIRERYGVARPGEGEITIVRRAPTTTPDSAAPDNIFVKIFKAIFVW